MTGLKIAGLRAGWALVASALLLAGCGHREKPRVAAKPPPQRAAPKKAYASEDVWHLRIGLNVAALSCRGKGRVAVAPAYGRVLSRHAALMNAAHSAEQRRYGKSGYDRHATQMYNRFANQKSPEKFCATASQVAQRAGQIDSLALNDEASELLGRLRRWAG